jgi:hypothetical protein
VTRLYLANNMGIGMDDKPFCALIYNPFVVNILYLFN